MIRPPHHLPPPHPRRAAGAPELRRPSCGSLAAAPAIVGRLAGRGVWCVLCAACVRARGIMCWHDPNCRYYFPWLCVRGAWRARVCGPDDLMSSGSGDCESDAEGWGDAPGPGDATERRIRGRGRTMDPVHRLGVLSPTGDGVDSRLVWCACTNTQKKFVSTLRSRRVGATPVPRRRSRGASAPRAGPRHASGVPRAHHTFSTFPHAPHIAPAPTAGARACTAR